MEILHISAECYPAAKTGGLGDVVGALPKYLTQSGVESGVVIPMYGLKWFHNREFREAHWGSVRMDQDWVEYRIFQCWDASLGYPLFCVSIPGKFDRPGIYMDPGSKWGYGDEAERYLCFQQAVLQWVSSWAQKPKVLHCHDHHTGLIPFMTQYCPEFESLKGVATVFTIHNGQYQGWFSWSKMNLLPFFDGRATGLLDWNGIINPMASAVRCAWRVTTVSPGYLDELKYSSVGLESLFHSEWHKLRGIINGIDADVWDPKTDPMLAHRLENDDIAAFKAANKAVLHKRFNIHQGLPIIAFIGRLVDEKGADLLPDAIKNFLYSGRKAAFIVLGSGDPHVSEMFQHMAGYFRGYFDCSIEYNETLSHQIYAGADFLIMPSRVEPCGLNQLYSMRYGTIPIVREVGGLKNTVVDLGEEGARGFRFRSFTVEDCSWSMIRATDFYQYTDQVAMLRKRIMGIDFSWERSCHEYIRLYQEVSTLEVKSAQSQESLPVEEVIPAVKKTTTRKKK